MKLAIVGSRKIDRVDISSHIPSDVSEIVSGGARGVDSLAREYALRNGIKLTEFLPDYARYGRAAPIKRNELIAEYSDMALVFWDGSSKGTAHTVALFQKMNKEARVIVVG